VTIPPLGLTLTVTVVVDRETAERLSGDQSIDQMVTGHVQDAIMASAAIAPYLSKRTYMGTTEERPAVLVGLDIRT